MTDMVERVARAIYASRIKNFKVPHGRVLAFDELPDIQKAAECANARAAIEAMRELPENPDDPSRAPWAWNSCASHDEYGNAVVTREDWRSMIDAALADAAGGEEG